MPTNAIQTSNHKLSFPKAGLILEKVGSDLAFGVKIFGNESNKFDTIRVWTASPQDVFGIIATSSNRYSTQMNILEIQSFQHKPHIKLTVFISPVEDIPSSFKLYLLNDNFMELPEAVKKEEGENFISDYLRSKPDIQLTKVNFEKYFYNKNQYRWLKPELYK